MHQSTDCPIYYLSIGWKRMFLSLIFNEKIEALNYDKIFHFDEKLILDVNLLLEEKFIFG